MHGNIALVAQQRVAQRGDEDAGAAHLGQRAGEDVAVGPDMDEFDVETSDGGQPVGRLLRLGQGELARPGADPYSHFASCPAAG